MHLAGAKEVMTLSATDVFERAIESDTPAYREALGVAKRDVVGMTKTVGLAVEKAAEYQRTSGSSDSVEQLVAERVAQDFKVDEDTAKYIIRDVGMSASFSFITDAYRPKVLYWEALDMFRKLMLVGVVVLVGRGTSAQLAIAIVLSFFFFSLQLSVAPFKLNQDNMLRASSECHVFLVLVAALMMRTEPVGYEDASYDWILSTTFVILVPGAFVATVWSKVRFAVKMQSGTGIEAAFHRFRLGLAVGGDCAALFNRFEGLRSELERLRRELGLCERAVRSDAQERDRWELQLEEAAQGAARLEAANTNIRNQQQL